MKTIQLPVSGNGEMAESSGRNRRSGVVVYDASDAPSLTTVKILKMD